MNSWSDLHEIVGIPRVSADTIIPDGNSHLVYVTNRSVGMESGLRQIGIMVTGFQWDILWWIYRIYYSVIEMEDIIGGFYTFVAIYMQEVFDNYIDNQ